MITFKQYINESALDSAIKIVKKFLGAEVQKVDDFDDSVLDSAKREEQQFIQTGLGKLIVSIYKTRTETIAQVTQPSGSPLYFVQA